MSFPPTFAEVPNCAKTFLQQVGALLYYETEDCDNNTTGIGVTSVSVPVHDCGTGSCPPDSVIHSAASATTRGPSPRIYQLAPPRLETLEVPEIEEQLDQVVNHGTNDTVQAILGTSGILSELGVNRGTSLSSRRRFAHSLLGSSRNDVGTFLNSLSLPQKGAFLRKLARELSTLSITVSANHDFRIENRHYQGQFPQVEQWNGTIKKEPIPAGKFVLPTSGSQTSRHFAVFSLPMGVNFLIGQQITENSYNGLGSTKVLTNVVEIDRMHYAQCVTADLSGSNRNIMMTSVEQLR